MKTFAVLATRSALFVALLSFGPLARAAGLKLSNASQSKSFSLDELKAKLTVQSRTLVDPVYKTKKTYEGFLLKDLLALNPQPAGSDEIAFHAVDGYAPSMPLDLALGHEALLAFREKGRKGDWEAIHQGKSVISPAPFYLVWTEGSKLGEEFPWPYQLVEVEVVSLAKVYDRAFPKNAAQNVAVTQGFYVFKTACIRCHSINLQGGELGPELNIPRNVTEYWNHDTMLSFVKNSESFRLKDKMPSFESLGDAKLQQVFAYLEFMSKQKIFPK